MSRTSVVVLSLCIVLAIEYVNSSVITSRDVKVGDVTTSEVAQDETAKDKINVPIEVASKPTPSKCAAIGEFCTYHSDCCTNSCLGYMKRCVT